MMKYKSKSNILCVEAGRTKLKILAGRIKNKKEEAEIRIVDIPGEGTESAVKNIAGVFNGYKLKEFYKILLIPRQELTIRHFRLPSKDEAEINNMVKFQAAGILPYIEEDIVYSYFPLNGKDENLTLVLAAVIKKEIVLKLLESFAREGFFPDRISVSSEGLFRWFNRRFTGREPGPSGINILLDFEENEAELCIFSEEGLLFTRSLAVKREPGTGHIDLSLFLPEFKQSLAYFEKNISRNKPGSIYISGYSPGNILEIAEEYEIPAQVIPEPEYPAGIKNLDEIRVNKCSVTALLGFYYARELTGLDLMPQEIIRQRKAKSGKREILLSIFLFIMFLSSASALLIARAAVKRQVIKTQEEQIKKIEPKVKELEILRKKLDIIKAVENPSNSAFHSLYFLHLATPGKISLKSVNYRFPGTMIIKGEALKMSEVLDYVKSISASEYFGNADLNYASVKKNEELFITEFQITTTPEKGK